MVAENFFKYMRENYGLDRLAENSVGPVPDTVLVVHPEHRKLDSSIRTLTAEMNRCNTKFGSLNVEGPLEAQVMVRFQNQKSELLQRREEIKQDLDKLKAERKLMPKQIAIKDLPESARFERLLPERKHFVEHRQNDCLPRETSMMHVLREKLARHDDARALSPGVRQRSGPGARSCGEDAHRKIALPLARCSGRRGQPPL